MVKKRNVSTVIPVDYSQYDSLFDKLRFVRPIYPPSCTDDFEYIRTHNCSKLLWPKHLKRDE